MESDKKRRILFIGEASFLATGFSTYWNEVLQRLHQTGEFEIAELGSYAHDDDERCGQVPWKFYPVAPAKSNRAAVQKYSSGQCNQFGEWRFDDICIEFRPDIVIGIRDWWMDEFVLRSSLRKNFVFIWMPTIDGEPQRELWLDSYLQCDRILTYSEYGMNLLRKTCRKGTNLVAVASPGADLEMFKPPEDKKGHKARLGIDPNALIVGTVMRNQKRKLYYDLAEGFSKWINHSKVKGHLELAKKTFLYLHTSYPDVGYDIGKAIRDFNIGNKVIMTYLCGNCQSAYPSFFAGEMMICRRCGKLAAHPPNANHSCPRNVLADIMRTFDLYVQFSICEGWGMPLTEAQACGIPTMAVRYSAMEDHLQNPTAIPIEVERFFWESIIETEQRRALPSHQDFVNKLDRFLKQSESVRDEKSKQTRAYIEELVPTYGQDTPMRRRGWERTAAIWAQVIRETTIKDQKDTWLCPFSRTRNPELVAPSNDMNNSEFVNWVIGKVWGRPDMLHTHFASDWLKSLNSGSRTVGEHRVPFDRNKLVEHFLELVKQSNSTEERRLAALSNQQQDSVKVVVM
jgi:glycosyltransferase involved in cell wall biosynthesis